MKRQNTTARWKWWIFIAGAGAVLFGVWGVLRGSGARPLQTPDPASSRDSISVVHPLAVPVEQEREKVSVPAAVEGPAAQAAVLDPETKSAQVEARIKALKAIVHRPRPFRENLESMARRADEVSVDTLIALSEAHDEELPVVEALGGVRRADQRRKVGEHLRGKIADSPLPVMMAALKSYARVMGDEAIPVVKESIQSQWRRPDGFGEMAGKAAVQGLGSIPTPAAQAALIAELERVSEPGWLPDYGSAVVAELGKRKTPEASAALRAYAVALEMKMPPENNPPGRQYYQEKIAEATQAAAGQASRE